MINFMCQLSKVMVPKYLVKYYSGYFYEGIFFLDEITDT